MLTIEQRLAHAAKHHQAGRLSEAEAVYRDVLRDAPCQPIVLYLLGLLVQQTGRHREAIELFRKALEARGPHPAVHSNLAASYLAVGLTNEGVAHCREAVRLDPKSPGPHNNLGSALLAQGLLDQAAESFRAALRVAPNDVVARCNLAAILQRFGRHAEEVALLREAVRLAPGNAQVHNQLGWALLSIDKPEEAVGYLREAVRLLPSSGEALNNLGVALRELNQGAEAIEYFEKSLRRNPNSVAARHNLGHTLESQGRISEAISTFEEALLVAPDNTMILTSLGRLVSDGFYQFSDEQIRHIQELAKRTELPPDDRHRLHLVLAWVFNRTGDYENAFAHCQCSSAIRKEADRRRGIVFDRADHRRFIDRTISVFTPEWFERAATFGVQSELPIFVVGMMRSGTSLVEQILASHPQVYGAGELPDLGRLVAELPRLLGTTEELSTCFSRLDAATSHTLAEQYLRKLREVGGQATRVVDKMPSNFLRLGILAALFPKARFIHCRRDPLDTCLSCYFQNFSGAHPYTLDLTDLGSYYRDYERLMAHWSRVLPVPIFHLSYEELTADLEGTSRRLLAFCGLEWDDRCLRFHENPRIVKTSSVLQVRQPVYRSSVGKWKRYEAYLQPLIEALREGVPQTAERADSAGQLPSS